MTRKSASLTRIGRGVIILGLFMACVNITPTSTEGKSECVTLAKMACRRAKSCGAIGKFTIEQCLSIAMDRGICATETSTSTNENMYACVQSLMVGGCGAFEDTTKISSACNRYKEQMGIDP